MHLNGLNLSGQLVRSEGDNHTGFDDTSFDNGGISRFDILDRDVLDVVFGEKNGLNVW